MAMPERAIDTRWRYAFWLVSLAILLDGARLLYVAAVLAVSGSDTVSCFEPIPHLGFVAEFIIAALYLTVGKYEIAGSCVALPAGILFRVMALGLLTRQRWAHTLATRVFSVLLLLAPVAGVIYTFAWAPVYHRHADRGDGSLLLVLFHLFVFGLVLGVLSRPVVKAHFHHRVAGDNTFPALPPPPATPPSAATCHPGSSDTASPDPR
jgi:hypothetical protein